MSRVYEDRQGLAAEVNPTQPTTTPRWSFIVPGVARGGRARIVLRGRGQCQADGRTGGSGVARHGPPASRRLDGTALPRCSESRGARGTMIWRSTG